LPKVLSDEKVIPEAGLAPEQLQLSIPETNALPLANQPVKPPGGREQMVVKQLADTELSTVAPLLAQSLHNQQSQDDNDFLSRDSFPASHGLSELRTDKLREPIFDTTQQISTPNQQEIVRQIVDHARLYLRPANQSEMVLQLRPEHLGELTLKVSVESGIVSATFHSDNPEVRQVIEVSLPQLKQDLSQQGIKLDSVSVFSGSEQFFDNRQPSAQQQQSVPLRKNRRELMQAIEAAEEVSVSTRDGVDYRI
jgi:flagellar hook-length control protein FliK